MWTHSGGEGIRYLIATDVPQGEMILRDVGLVVKLRFSHGKGDFCAPDWTDRRNGKAGRAASLVTEDEIRTLHKAEAYVGVRCSGSSLSGDRGRGGKAFWALQRKKPDSRPP